MSLPLDILSMYYKMKIGIFILYSLTSERLKIMYVATCAVQRLK